MRKEEPEESGVRFEYECEDVGNTKVAEQTINMFRGFKGVITSMRTNYACFFLRTMVDFINVHNHNKLVLAGKLPSGDKFNIVFLRTILCFGVFSSFLRG